MNSKNAKDMRTADARSINIASRIAPFVNNLMMRFAIAMVLALMLGQTLSDLLQEIAIPSTCQMIANRLAMQVNAAAIGPNMLQAVSDYGLAFIFISEGDLTATPETQPFAGNFRLVRLRPGMNVIGGRRFYVAKATFSQTKQLYLGMEITKALGWQSFFTNPLGFLESRSDRLHLLISITFLATAIFLVCYLSVVKPVQVLTNLPLEGEERQKVLSSGMKLAAFEIMHMYKALMAYVNTNQAKPADWSRPIEKRIDDATQTRLPASQSSTRWHAETTSAAESPVLRTLEHSLTRCSDINEFRQELLNSLSHMSYKYFVLLQHGGDNAVEGSKNLDQRALKLIHSVDHQTIMKNLAESNKTIDIGAMSLRRFGYSMLAEYMHLRSVRYVPIKHQTKLVGAIVLLLDSQTTEDSDAQVDLESFCSRIGVQMSRLIKKHELERASMKDQLTGLPNRKVLQDFLSDNLQASAKEDYSIPMSLLIIQPNVTDTVISQHGEAVRDKILQEVAEELHGSTKTQVEGKASYQLVRYDAEEFALCAKPMNAEEAVNLSRIFQSTIQRSKQAIGDLFGITLTIGCATCPADARDERALLARAKLAMRFAEEFKGEDRLACAREVPLSYEPSKKMADISGELGVLDCSALLQSIANSQKTGVLIVEDELGRSFQAVFKTGRLLASDLEGFNAVNAVIEFVTCFEAGRYNFRMVSDAEVDKMVPADSRHPSLDKCLMEAALAEDHLKVAKKGLKEGHLVRATPGEEAAQRWWDLQRDTRNYSEVELQTMQKILALADGNKTLGQIFVEVSGVPTYLKWHCAFIVTENRLMQAKRSSA
jgi:diguanylate cyclase (GGDEF)-like protein